MAFGAIHYLAAAFAELNLDFMAWEPATRFIFSVFGFLALIVMLLYLRFDLWDEKKIKISIEDDEETIKEEE